MPRRFFFFNLKYTIVLIRITQIIAGQLLAVEISGGIWEGSCAHEESSVVAKYNFARTDNNKRVHSHCHVA